MVKNIPTIVIHISSRLFPDYVCKDTTKLRVNQSGVISAESYLARSFQEGEVLFHEEVAKICFMSRVVKIYFITTVDNTRRV